MIPFGGIADRPQPALQIAAEQQRAADPEADQADEPDRERAEHGVVDPLDPFAVGGDHQPAGRASSIASPRAASGPSRSIDKRNVVHAKPGIAALSEPDGAAAVGLEHRVIQLGRARAARAGRSRRPARRSPLAPVFVQQGLRFVGDHRVDLAGEGNVHRPEHHRLRAQRCRSRSRPKLANAIL